VATPATWEREELRGEGTAGAGEPIAVGRTPWQLFWVRFRRDKVALAALAYLVLLVVAAILAGPITRVVAHPPDAQFPNTLDPQFGTPTGPSSTFLFGVDKVGEDVFSRVLYGARVSLEVALLATFLSVAIGVVLGMTAGYFRGWADTLISRVIDVTLAFPILLLALGIGSACSLGKGCAGGAVKPGLPTVILAIVVINWSEDYVRTARAKGLHEWRVIVKHALRVALTPIVTIAGLDLGLLLGGAVLAETVFNIPGVGRFAYDSIINSDLPSMQGTVLFGAFFIILANLVVDILYAFLDPRVRY
jgi:ABC-type dipeptide/oligopeptide/nickel transport system permease subunit